MNDTLFKIIFIILLIAGTIVRLPYFKRYQTSEKVASKNPKREKIVFVLTSLGLVVVPLVYVLTPWFDSFGMHMPAWARITGAVIYCFGILVVWQIHQILGENWSPLLEIRKNHTMITVGPYKYIRHPLYSAFYLLVIGQGILLSNWIVELAGLVTVSILCLVRIKSEEEMMLDEFGTQYEEYMKRTGRLVPKIVK